MEEQYIKGDEPLWEYLNTKPYSIRRKMAEFFLADEHMVIDIGAYKEQLNVNYELISIDPLKTFDGGYNKDIASFVSEFDFRPYSISCLGLAIEGGEKQRIA
mgnify:FL=1